MLFFEVHPCVDFYCLLSRIFHLYLSLPDEGEREETVEDRSLLRTLPPGRLLRYDPPIHVRTAAWGPLGEIGALPSPVSDAQSGAPRPRRGARPEAGPVLPGRPYPPSTRSTPAPPTARPPPPTPARRTWRTGDPTWVRRRRKSCQNRAHTHKKKSQFKPFCGENPC